ncbi:hypothetical protein DL765_003352 [Monosporascus sp. GIB2]|nr:hypothetical protein DL765_003352 [Monosporascus sp. GIB2]
MQLRADDIDVGGGNQEEETEEQWVERDDVDIINEEQAPLLELHEELVVEFGKKALMFIKNGPDGRPLFPDFWSSYWIVRIKEVLEKLDGQELTDAERRGAEEIGVQWCDPVEKKEEENPYGRMTLEYYFYELDLIFRYQTSSANEVCFTVHAPSSHSGPECVLGAWEAAMAIRAIVAGLAAGDDWLEARPLRLRDVVLRAPSAYQ